MKEKIIHVRIDKAVYGTWYKDRIGSIITVEDYSTNYYMLYPALETELMINKSDCTIIDLRPGRVINNLRWYSILDKDLPEVQKLIGKKVYFSDNPFHIAPNKRTLEIINHNGFSYLSVVWPFIGIKEKPSPKIPDENTPRGTRVHNGETENTRSHGIFLCMYRGKPIIADEVGNVCCWKYAEILEDEG